MAGETKQRKKNFSPGGGKIATAIKPMLARETDIPFDDKDWIFEIKWDGYRAISEMSKGRVRLYSRNGNDFTGAYPLVVQELKKIPADVVLDGEIVVLDDKGNPNFQLLQHYGEDPHHPICYYVFDILRAGRQDTTQLPLLDRKKLLKKALPKNAVIRYSDHITGKGIDFFRAARHKDLEGVMAKRADSTYDTGTRSSDWLKIKHHKSDEAVIVGYTEPTGSRPYFGALVLARPSGGKWIYAGHTGTGFDHKTLKEIYDILKKTAVQQSPFSSPVKTNMPVTWVQPKYIAELRFSELTRDGIMRHPVFVQLRNDKTINDLDMKTTIKKTGGPKTVAGKKKGAAATRRKSTLQQDEELKVGKVKVKLTNQDKVYWPEEGITKGDMVQYYQRMAEYILPYLKDRPESLKRNPNGIKDEGFFHKDAGDEAPDYVRSVPIFSESTNKDVDYIICNDRATLAYLNNLGCIELNPWNSTIRKPDHPDYLIIDIDPSEKNSFEQVIEVANAFKEVLNKAGVEGYCKTSGASGLHIFIPMGKKYEYELVKYFAHLLCTLVQEMLPGFTTLERNLSKRGTKHIYLDYLQNRRGQTLACAYSLRPKKGATVSAPLRWKEVKKGLHPSQFTIYNMEARVKKTGDIFKPVLGKGVDINACLRKLGNPGK